MQPSKTGILQFALLFALLLLEFTIVLINGQGQGQEEEEECDAIRAICPDLVEDANKTYPAYAGLRTPELIERLGYPVEIHNITTEDGYILTTYRIPYTNSSTETTGKIPVFLMHGIFSSSVQWLWQPPARALVFMLADAGYDVWIGNARGTSYSLGHTHLDSNSSTDLSYWDFSHHEMGYYDLPASIDYILETTEQQSLYYIGHSLGWA